MNKWLKEIYEKCIYEKRLMDARELESWDLTKYLVLPASLRCGEKQ